MSVRAPREAPDSFNGMEDAELARMVAAGDEAAFEALFDRHHRGLLSLCRHMLGSREEAEDALQHTFAAAYQQLEGGDVPTRLRPWLYAVARNRCISLIRARREVPSEEVPVSGSGLSDEVEQRADLRELVSDIGRLPDDQRAALVLSELQDLRHEEVAEAIGCRQEKVRALVYQARSSLAGWRAARETPCREVREHLATASGGALRRASIQRHLKVCEDCTTFRDAVTSQRRRVALVLPVLATPLLKERVLEAAHAAAEGAAAAAAGGGAAAGGAAAAEGAGAGGAAAGGGALRRGRSGGGGGRGGRSSGRGRSGCRGRCGRWRCSRRDRRRGGGAGAAGAAATGGALAGAGKIAAVVAVVAGGAGLGTFGLRGGDGSEGQRQAEPPDQAQVAADKRAERQRAERRRAAAGRQAQRRRAERRRTTAARRAAAGQSEQLAAGGQPASASGAQPAQPAPAQPAPAQPAPAPPQQQAPPVQQQPQPQVQSEQPAAPEPQLPEADGQIEAVPAEPQTP